MTIEVMKQAEPVAWRSWNFHDGYGFWDTKDEAGLCCDNDFTPEPLYTSPPFCPPEQAEQAQPKCNPHPKAPHGFDRNASHSANRYVCECEWWDAYDAGYKEGFACAIEAANGIKGEA